MTFEMYIYIALLFNLQLMLFWDIKWGGVAFNISIDCSVRCFHLKEFC